MSQFDGAGLAWKGYFQGLPYAGFRGVFYPDRCDRVPDFSAFCAGKHNGIPYFKSVQDSPSEFAKNLPIQQRSMDLATNPPSFGHIVPDQCHDMAARGDFQVSAVCGR